MGCITTYTNDQIARFEIESSGSSDVTIQWRYVNASDPDHWVYLLERDGDIVSVWQAEDHCVGHDPFNIERLREENPDIDLQIHIVKLTDAELATLRARRKELKRSLSYIIINEYEIDQEIAWKETYIIEHDEWDELEGEVYLTNEDGSTLKKVILTEKPDNINKVVNIKKKTT
jgi:hypothetical protein